MKGQELIVELIKATELPEKSLTIEVNRLLQQANKKNEDLTMDDLRSILASYLQEVLLEAKQIHSA